MQTLDLQRDFLQEGLQAQKSNVDYHIPQALAFTNDNVYQDGKVLYLPIYMVAFLEKQTPVDVAYRLDL